MRNLLLGLVLGIVLTSVGAWAGSEFDPFRGGGPTPLEKLQQRQQQQKLDQIEQQNQEILQNQRRSRLNPC